MKTKLGKIALWSFIVMMCAVFIVGIILRFNYEDIVDKFEAGKYHTIVNWKSFGYSRNIESKKEFSIDDIEGIDISSVSANINIYATHEKKGQVYLYGESYSNNEKHFPELSVKKKNDKVIVEIKNSAFITSSNLKLDVYIPQKQIDEIYIETVSGGINIEKLNFILSNINTVSGDVNIQEATSAMNIDSVSGDIEIFNTSFEKTSKINTISGDVSIEIAENAKGFILEYSTLSGNFKENYIGELEVENNDNIIVKYGLEEAEIIIVTTSGNLKIQ